MGLLELFFNAHSPERERIAEKKAERLKKAQQKKPRTKSKQPKKKS